MKRILSLAAAAAMALCVITAWSQAQTGYLRLRFHVPFSFTIRNQTFAPGDYEFTRQSLMLSGMTNLKGEPSIFETVEPAQSRKEGNGQVRLVFHRYGDQYFLYAVSAGSLESTYDFKVSSEEKMLAQANPRTPVTTVSVSPGGAVLVASRGQN
jgi:hypothetical protein